MSEIKSIQKLRIQASMASARAAIANYELTMAERMAEVERVQTEIKRQKDLIETYEKEISKLGG